MGKTILQIYSEPEVQALNMVATMKDRSTSEICSPITFAFFTIPLWFCEHKTSMWGIYVHQNLAMHQGEIIPCCLIQGRCSRCGFSRNSILRSYNDMGAGKLTMNAWYQHIAYYVRSHQRWSFWEAKVHVPIMHASVPSAWIQREALYCMNVTTLYLNARCEHGTVKLDAYPCADSLFPSKLPNKIIKKRKLSWTAPTSQAWCTPPCKDLQPILQLYS